MKKFFVAALMLCGLFVAAQVQAAAFPTKDIKVIVPFAPGGGVDVTVRMLAEVAPQFLNGKNLIVQNMPGGGAVTGQAAAAKAKADGYTLLAYTSSVISNPLLKATPFKSEDFTPVNMYCFDPEILVVPANSPYKTLKEFVEAAKTKSISMATPGHSTSHHIAAILMENDMGTKFDYIHNSSAPQQIAQLMGGHVESAMMAYGEVTSYLKDGSLRALGLMSDASYIGAENIERFSKLGFKREHGAFRGLAVPAGTPKAVVDALSEAFAQMAADPTFVKRMNEADFPILVKNAADFSAYAAEQNTVLKELMPVLQPKK